MATPFATFAVQEEPFVVRITINREQGDNQDFKDIIAAFLKIFELQKRVSVIIDASELRVLNKENVKDIRHFIKHNRPVFQEFLKCSSLVVRSVMVKNVINLLFKVQPPVRPNLIVNTMEDAVQFVSQY
jgi:hypothetical protein